MDEDERKRKLEAGKAKLANYRKKKQSKIKKSDSALSTPRDPSIFEDVEAGDSTAVQTGDDSSLHVLTPSDDSEQSTTTAEDISTEEEASYSCQLTPVERIQELELTVSDQQEALQKLTLENKTLRESCQHTFSQSDLDEHETLVKELQEGIIVTQEQVRNMLESIDKTTAAVRSTSGEQSQTVTELIETKAKLENYEATMIKQEQTLQQMAKKLEEKSLEAGEAADRIHSLQVELEKSQSLLVSSLHNAPDQGILREEVDREKNILKAELEAQHFEEISTLKMKHKSALEAEIRKRKHMEEEHQIKYDPEDARAYREQAELLRSQLETAYRDNEKMKRDHDKEVIELSQQLVNNADEYESRLQSERASFEELEKKHVLSDAVSSKIQSSFSKQLEQLEEERDLLRQQLRQTQSQSKENLNLSTRITNLEDEVLSYQTELAQVSNRLEDAEKQKRHFRDEMERSQEAADKLKKEKSELERKLEEFNVKMQDSEDLNHELKQKMSSLSQEYEDINRKHKNEIADLETKIADLQDSATNEKLKADERIKEISNEHSEELKNLHSQHHRQMDELKKDLEMKLEDAKCSLEGVRKEQLESVKDVHEKSRDRELARIKENHEKTIHDMIENHEKVIEALKTEAAEVKNIAEERLRIELKENFDVELEKELSLLRRTLEKESNLALTEMQEKHHDELEKMKIHHKEEMDDILKHELEKQRLEHENMLVEQKQDLDSALEEMKLQFENAQNAMSREHTETLSKMEAEIEDVHQQEEDRSTKSTEAISKLEADLREADDTNKALKDEMSILQKKLDEELQNIKERFKNELNARESSNLKEMKVLEEKLQNLESENDLLKEEVSAAQTERDHIFAQAEESQKRLAVLHHEDTVRMQEELDQMEADHQEKVEQMQFEIESLRASRNDLQDLRSQLLARNASVEEMTLMKDEFSQEKEKLLGEVEEQKLLREKLLLEHKEELDKLREEHQQELQNEQDRIAQLLQDLDASREKLDEASVSTAPLESSPFRSASQMSEYDSSNVEALNKDYRSAMTLTHVSGVSGLSDSLSVVAEEAEDSATVQNLTSKLEETIEDLQRQLHKAKEDIEKLKEDHGQTLSTLEEEHSQKLEKIQQSFQNQITELKTNHDKDLSNTKEVLNELKETHKKEITQIHLQCASDTAKQIEDETDSLRTQLQVEFEEKMDSMKHQLELENNEKLTELQTKHEEELEKQANELSSSLEIRISALMEEFHEQKKVALEKSAAQHQEELSHLRQELDEKMEVANQKVEELSLSWKKREEDLQRIAGELEVDLERSREEYKLLLSGLDTGDSTYIKNLQEKYEMEKNNLKKELEIHYDEKQKIALKQQADTLEQARVDFMAEHKTQFDKFIADQNRDAEAKEAEMNAKVEEVGRRLAQNFEQEKAELVSAHNDEMKIVATKLVEVENNNERLQTIKSELIMKIEMIQQEHIKELADMKANLVNQHMIKFQEVTVNLDQLHKEEIDNAASQHHDKVLSLNQDIDNLQEKVDNLEVALRKEKEMKENMISIEDMNRKIQEMRDSHEEKIKKAQEDYDDQLQQIEEEIKRQSDEHNQNMNDVLAAQGTDMVKLHEQLKLASEAGAAEEKKLRERLMELENQVKDVDVLRNELDDACKRKHELEAIVEEWKMKMNVWEEERGNEKENYEKRIGALSERFNSLQEEYKDLNSRIEFERAEYEAELESAQEEARSRGENIKELEAEIEHKNAALNSLVEQKEKFNERNEHESLHTNNVLEVLRDEKEKLSSERNTITGANKKLLSVLSDLVQANYRCEKLISTRLRNLPIMNAENNEGNVPPEAGNQIESTASGSSSSSSGYEEELLRQFDESMFVGPEFDPSSLEAATSSGTKVRQATERVFDMLEHTIRELNTAQQAQTMLGNELERVVAKKATMEDETSDEKQLYQNLIRANEELAKEKELLIEKHKQEKTRLVETAHQIEDAMDQFTKMKNDQEQEYISQIEDLTSQIASLQKQTESRSRFADEMTNERQAEREQFDKEMEALRNEIDEVRDSAKADVADKINHLEEELDSKQKLQEESAAEIERLKEILEEKENEITDLEERVRTNNKSFDKSTDESDLQQQLEESKRQEEVLQEELYENMLRISALEAQLDRYRHGMDEDAITALEKAELEERRQKELALQQLEEKEQEVDTLVEQQQLLRTQIIEKEEEVTRLLQQMDVIDNLKAENMKLKEDLEEISTKISEPTRIEHLEALSQQLLDEKNTEIDDLRHQISILRSADRISKYEQEFSQLQAQLQEQASVNEELKTKLKRFEDEEIEHIGQSDIVQNVLEEAPLKSSNQGDTDIHNLTTADLNRSEDLNQAAVDSDLQTLIEENSRLHEELEIVKKRAEDLLSLAEKEDVFKLPPGLKEKIRDMEEKLSKEKDETLLEKSSPESVPANSSLSTEVDLTPFKETLHDIEEEIRSSSSGVLGAILRVKSSQLEAQQKLIDGLSNELFQKQEELLLLQKKMLDSSDSASSSEDEVPQDTSFQPNEPQEAGKSTVEKVNSSQDCTDEEVSDEDQDHLTEETLGVERSSKVHDGPSNKSPIPEDVKNREVSGDETLDTIGENSQEEEVSQLKLLLSEKEDAILKRDAIVARLQETIDQNAEKMMELSSKMENTDFKFHEVSSELDNKCLEFEEYKLKYPESLIDDIFALKQKEEQLEAGAEDLNSKLKTAVEDRKRMSQMLDDVQREYASLLEDIRKLEELKHFMEGEINQKTSRIEELEKTSQEYGGLHMKAQEEADELKKKLELTNKEMDEIMDQLYTFRQDKETIKADYDKLFKTKETDHGLNQSHINGAGDASHFKRSLIIPSPDEEESVEVARLLHENEALKEEISNMTFRAEELQVELDSIKQSRITEEDSVLSPPEEELVPLQEDHQSTRIEQSFSENPTHNIASRHSSLESQSSSDLQEVIEELKKEHQIEMEEIKNKYSHELEEAVSRATKEQNELNNRRLSELKEKHRQEIADLLSESAAGESELAQRLRNELDIADKLDSELINQLKTVAQYNGLPTADSFQDSYSSSPEKETEISSRLQHLLSRLHNEGVQVLSLSELQFLKQYQPLCSVSINTDPLENETSARPLVNMDKLKRAWETEKLALLDAIQTLKELLTHTANETAQLSEDDDSIRWRGELLRSIADLFEREKRALLAELQASVVEAHAEMGLDGDLGAMAKLDVLEQKIRNQELQHRSELERLLAADRDQLAADVKQLKEDRKEKLDQANKRIEKLQEQFKNTEDNNKSMMNQLQNEIELLHSKLDQEQALTSDLRTSLKLEKQRSCDLLPALDRERNRTLELSTEIATLSESNRVETNELWDENEKLRSNVVSLTRSLEETLQKLKCLEDDCNAKSDELVKIKNQQDQFRNKDQEKIERLQEALSSEEARRREALKVVENEKRNSIALQEQFACERGRMQEDIVQLKMKCNELSSVVSTEKERSDKLQSALERETALCHNTRLELEREKRIMSEAREHDRATVVDLQIILENAKKESEKVQKRVELAEREREEAIRKAQEEIFRAEEERKILDRRSEEERASRNEALSRERRARSEFQTALESEKLSKQEIQDELRQLQKQRREMLQAQEESPNSAQESLLGARRQLESLRQRLQLEASKFQNVVNHVSVKPLSHHREPYSTMSQAANSLLTSEIERIESMKRALSDMQDELKELYSQLSIPKRVSDIKSVRPIEFNDRLLQENAELSQYAAEAAKETKELRDIVNTLKNGRNRVEDGASTANQQKMANRLHKWYTRYTRAESFRKSLVYQKKYLLLLLGGFQDCEDATLAMIARLGAYPSDDAIRRTISRRSEAFTKFRSAARVIIAICRMKFLVRKSQRNLSHVSAAIQHKHGIPVCGSAANIACSGKSAKSPSLSPRSDDRSRHSSGRHSPVTSLSPFNRISVDPPSRDTSPFTSGSYLRASSSPYSPRVPVSTHDYSFSRDRYENHRGYSPAALPSYSAMQRSAAGDTDPSLNDYIQKLENIQTKLRIQR